MSTYIAYDHQDEKDEMRRLTIQDQMITSAMGGVLSEQADPTVFRHVLDIGCATGGWVIAAAKHYPEMMLTGIDVSRKMIDYASQQARAWDAIYDSVSLSVQNFPTGSLIAVTPD